MMNATKAVTALSIMMIVAFNPLTSRERAMVDAWLTCIDCDVELDSLRAVAARNAEATIDTLSHVLESGPSTALRLHATSQLARGFVRDSSYRVRHGLPIIGVRSTYVAVNLERYVNGYRSRAAYGLGYIHTSAAIAVLNAALLTQLPASVSAAVLDARDHIP